MPGRAGAEGGEIEAVRRLPAAVDECRQILVRGIGRHHQHEVGAHHFGDRREIAGRVVIQVAVGGRRNADGTDLAQEQGLAVRRTARHGLRGDLPARAHLVFHHHAFTQQRPHVLRQRARHDVGPRSRRKAHVQTHGAVGELRHRRDRQAQQEAAQQAAQRRCHGCLRVVWVFVPRRTSRIQQMR
ncbi:hypothetical protein D3C71_1659280 [compost metagenome]